MQPTPFSIRLEDAFMASPKVKHFIFKSESVFNYLPGQFITLHFEWNNKIVRRSYSIANSPQQNNQIEFAAGYVEGGPGTNLLFNLKPSDTLQMTGPYGRLILKEDIPERYILVATSTGITPYRCMLDELKCRLLSKPSLSIVVLQGVQKREDILYGDEFLALTKQFPQVMFRTYLSREEQPNASANEYSGYVQSAFPDLALKPEKDLVYLCGNPSMIDDSFEYLKEQGFTTQHVIREKYISNK